MKPCLLLIVLFIIVSCKKEDKCQNCPKGNKPPIANAGPDQVVNLPTNFVDLNGSTSSDPDNDITNYLWTKISGPSSFRINNINTWAIRVVDLVEGFYEFELKVTDAKGNYDLDTVQVEVKKRASDPVPAITDPFYLGNVFFYCPDPTGTMPTRDGDGWQSPYIYWSDGSGNTNGFPLVKVQIGALTDQLAGVWCKSCSPRCPVTSDYNVEYGNTVSFRLLPGTYQWTAESTTDISRFNLALRRNS